MSSSPLGSKPLRRLAALTALTVVVVATTLVGVQVDSSARTRSAVTAAASGTEVQTLTVEVDDQERIAPQPPTRFPSAADDRATRRALRQEWRQFWRQWLRWWFNEKRRRPDPEPTPIEDPDPTSTTTPAPTTTPTPTPTPTTTSTPTPVETTTSAPPATSPTTAAPATTAAPTTVPPTTVSPTTEAPTTSPTTSAPTTSPPPSHDPQIWRITVGSENRTPLDTSSPAGAGGAHGTRVYCPISHFSYDDPIVFPGQPGAAHLHMFWGNTETDAFSTGDSIANSGGSSCEGGTNNRSAYWIPAVYNENGEVVLPESAYVEYKSFFRGDIGDRSLIKPIPNGLEMLASSNVQGSRSWHFQAKTGGGDLGPTDLRIEILFPQCLQVDGQGQPVLSSADNVSHLAYGDSVTPSNCPASHPYRIPQIFYNIDYAIHGDSDWSLSSDGSGSKGHSLHADYMAGWDPESMDAVVECNIVERRECSFEGNRGQLTERFYGPDGNRVYRYSVTLMDNVDRTPLGANIPTHSRHR